MKKFLISVLAICIVILAGTAFQNVSAEKRDSLYTVRILADDRELDLKNIVFDIYTSELDENSDIESGTLFYNEYYYTSVETDIDGIAVFEKPSNSFSVSVETQSLPKGYGVQLRSHFFYEGQGDYDFVIKKLSNVDVEVHSYNNSKNLDSVRIYWAEGQLLSAESKINDKRVYIKNELTTESINKGELQVGYEYHITAAGENYVINKQLDFHYDSSIERARVLKETGLISEYEYMNEIANFILFGNRHEDLNSYGECGDGYWIELNTYRSLHNEEELDFCLIDMALSSFGHHENDNRSLTYIDSSSGKFRIYYETSLTTYEKATAVANTFEDVDYFFCVNSNMAFQRPFNPSTSKFYVFIIPLSTGVGETVYNNGSPYINIDYSVANYISSTTPSISNEYKGVVAHEYFHAIMQYQGIVNEKWLHESFASWAGLAYKHEYAILRAYSVQDFLSTPNESLNTISGIRCYGSCLFPLFIQLTSGSNNVIKKIITSYNASSGALSAVSSGLSYFGSNLATAYSGCATYNYDADYFYQSILSGTGAIWGMANRSIANSYPYDSWNTVPGLACGYTEFIGPNTPKTLTTIIDFSTYSGSPTAWIKAVRTTNDGSEYIAYPTINSGRCTIVQQNFGNNIAKKYAIIPMNVSSSGELLYEIHATLS